MARIKFCGITRPSDALLAATLGASYAGTIFADSPRRVTPAKAREIFASAGDLKRVGVFTGSIAKILRTAQNVELDVLQLHGGVALSELARLRDEFDGELWAVVSLEPERPELPSIWHELADVADALLVDTSIAGRSGGTGKTFDWAAAAPSVEQASKLIPIVLAGGLEPGNVADAINVLSPAVVDVSSGIESAPGVKDPAKMRAFAEAVHSASIV